MNHHCGDSLRTPLRIYGVKTCVTPYTQDNHHIDKWESQILPLRHARSARPSGRNDGDSGHGAPADGCTRTDGTIRDNGSNHGQTNKGEAKDRIDGKSKAEGDLFFRFYVFVFNYFSNFTCVALPSSHHLVLFSR